MKEYLVGIDVASSKVCAALGRKLDDGNFQLVGVTSVKSDAVSKAVVRDIEATTEAIKNCVSKLEVKTNRPVENVVLSFPGGLCELTNAKGTLEIGAKDRKITEEDTIQVLKLAKRDFWSEGKEIIGVIPKSYIIDSKTTVVNPIGMLGSRLEVHAEIVVSQTKPIFDLLLSMEHAGIVPEEVMIQPVALSTLLQKDEMRGYSVLIDIGAETADLCIYKSGNVCYTKLIPFGGSNITSDISKCLKISFEDAEKIKINYGDMGYKLEESEFKSQNITIKVEDKDTEIVNSYDLNEIISARIEEILKFILDELKTSSYYEYIELIVVTGGGFSLFNNINKLFEDILNKPVRIALPEMDKVTNTSNTVAMSIIKNKMNSYKLENNLEKRKEEVKEDSKKTKNKKFGWRITEFLDEFF
jgi:cell division protein FtsA